MNYQTRHLTAVQDISHGRRLVLAGQSFEAVEVDAQHYLTRGLAVDAPRAQPSPVATSAPAPEPQPAATDTAPVPVPEPAPQPAPAPATPRRAGRTTAASRSAAALAADATPQD